MLKKIHGYKTYSAGIAVVLLGLTQAIPSLRLPDDVINAIAVILGVAVVAFRSLAKPKAK
jgi:hypothetical protein